MPPVSRTPHGPLRTGPKKRRISWSVLADRGIPHGPLRTGPKKRDTAASSWVTGAGGSESRKRRP